LFDIINNGDHCESFESTFKNKNGEAIPSLQEVVSFCGIAFAFLLKGFSPTRLAAQPERKQNWELPRLGIYK